MIFQLKERRKMRTKIAILGGSFNPIHLGHLAIARAAHEMVGADILIMPNSKTYYKQNHSSVSDDVRCEMIQIAIKDYPYMKLSKLEIERGGETHTIDTIEEIENRYKKKNKKVDIYFIIGGDSLQYLDKWISAEQLFQKTIFLTAVRNEVDRACSLRIIEDYRERFGARIELLETENYDISSTKIRELAAGKNSLEGLVSEELADYIDRNNIYCEEN